MTDIELIATELLGWEREKNQLDPENHIEFNKNRNWLIRADPWTYEELEADKQKRCPDWPNPDDYNSIRRIEDALAKRNLLGPYLDKLEGIFMHEGTAYRDMSNSLHMGRLVHRPYGGLLEMGCALRATAAQRIAAAAQVMREVG